jgi:hypothetical protein
MVCADGFRVSRSFRNCALSGRVHNEHNGSPTVPPRSGATSPQPAQRIHLCLHGKHQGLSVALETTHAAVRPQTAQVRTERRVGAGYRLDLTVGETRCGIVDYNAIAASYLQRRIRMARAPIRHEPPPGVVLSSVPTIRGRAGAHRWLNDVLGVPVRLNYVRAVTAKGEIPPRFAEVKPTPAAIRRALSSQSPTWSATRPSMPLTRCHRMSKRNCSRNPPNLALPEAFPTRRT